jgi:hypothetical protein
MEFHGFVELSFSCFANQAESLNRFVEFVGVNKLFAFSVFFAMFHVKKPPRGTDGCIQPPAVLILILLFFGFCLRPF